MVIAFMLLDVFALLPAFFQLILIYLIRRNHRFTEWALRAWAVIYLLVFTGIKTGAETLIIWRGDGWEVDSLKYYIDLFLIALGAWITFFGDYMFAPKPAEKVV